MRRRRIALVAGGVVLLALVIGLAYRRQPAQPRKPLSAELARATSTAIPLAPTAVGQAVVAPTAVADSPDDALEQAPTTAPLVLASYFDDRRLTYEPGFYAPQIQALLDSQAGPLKTVVLQVGDRRHSFAEVLSGQTSYYGVNPKVILALIELQSRLLSTAGPSSDQVGWAAGYQGENGNKRGLQAQVRWAVKQLLYAKRD